MVWLALRVLRNLFRMPCQIGSALTISDRDPPLTASAQLEAAIGELDQFGKTMRQIATVQRKGWLNEIAAQLVQAQRSWNEEPGDIFDIGAILAWRRRVGFRPGKSSSQLGGFRLLALLLVFPNDPRRASEVAKAALLQSKRLNRPPLEGIIKSGGVREIARGRARKSIVVRKQ